MKDKKGLTTDAERGHEPRREKRELGKKGEEKALRFLKKNGYRIIEQNYVCKMGEMDIIAKEKDTLVFVEVKTRTSMAFGPPQLAVTPFKQRQLSKVASISSKRKSWKISRQGSMWWPSSFPPKKKKLN